MKSKGFTLGPATPGHLAGGIGGALDGECGGDVLYLPTGTDKVSEALPATVKVAEFLDTVLNDMLGASRYDVCKIFGFFDPSPLVHIWN